MGKFIIILARFQDNSTGCSYNVEKLAATPLEASRELEEGEVEFDNPISYFRF